MALSASSPASTAAAGSRVVGGTSPYPWPWQADLDPARTAFVITGAQHALLATAPWALPTLELIDRTAAGLRTAGVMVTWVRHARDEPTLDGTPGRASPAPIARRRLIPTVTQAALAGSVEPGDIVVDASGIDGFHGSRLDDVLRANGRELLLLGGIGLETTVHSTLRSANDRGYECLLLTDASAAHDPALTAASLSSICMSGGIFGAIGTAELALEALRDLIPFAPPEEHP